MRAEVYWIATPGPGRLAIMPHPQGDDWLAEELRSLKEQGATRVVSLLEEEQVEDLGLGAEGRLCEASGLGFRFFPIVDHSVPPLDRTTLDFIEELAREMRAGEGVAVHCMAGIGRSGLICTAALIALGLTPVEAMGAVSKARGLAIPETDEQCLWLAEYARGRTAPSPE